MKNVKGILKKILKFLLVVVILFMVYVLINFFYSKNFLVNVVEAINEDDVERIYELTGKQFYSETYTDYTKDGEKNTYYYSIYDYLNDESYMFLCEKGLESISFSIKSVKPILCGFLYEIDITYIPYETLLSSGENVKQFLESEYPVLYTEYLRSVSTNDGIDECQRHYNSIMSKLSQNIYLDDAKFKEEKYSMRTDTGNLFYNFFTRRFEYNGISAMYSAKKGWNQVLGIQYMMNINNEELIEEINFYDREGNKYSSEFYKDAFVSFYSYNLDGSIDNEEWIQINRQFIETEASKSEILTYLEQEGYIFADETLKFTGPDDIVEAAFYSGDLVWLSSVRGENLFEKNLSKEDVITLLKEYNYYLGEKIVLEKENVTISLYFDNEELAWLNVDSYRNYDELKAELVEHIERNKLNKKEALEFLFEKGFVEITE